MYCEICGSFLGHTYKDWMAHKLATLGFVLCAITWRSWG